MARTSRSESNTGSMVYDTYSPVFEKPVTCVIVAPRGSGKSVLLGDILIQNKDFFKDVVVFCGSQAVWNDFKDQLPPSRLFMGYSPENMARVSDQFKDTVKIFQAKSPGECWHGALVLDDLAFDKKIFSCIHSIEAWMKLHFRRNSCIRRPINLNSCF
jgi:hypothetical protein